MDGNSNKIHRRDNNKSIGLIKTLFKFEESYAKVRVVKIEIQKEIFKNNTNEKMSCNIYYDELTCYIKDV